MNKKAVSILMIIFELLAVVLIVSIVFSVAKAMGSSDRVFRINLANDIQMMTETLVSVPGDVVIESPYNVSGYVLILDQSSITVFKKGDSDDEKITKNFYLPEGYEAKGSLEEEERFCLEKESQTVFLRDCKPEEKLEQKILTNENE